ncbi:hypothetical protein EIM50_24535 [Pseudoxanthomonas sp. SGD-10]|nr:hypothetical protein EIM50_24535 [Pseudoxanthomonas sp. SGD-10]
MSKAKANDLVTFKPEIKRVLESEIVKRYYFDKGRIEQNFQYDEEIKKALELFSNKAIYHDVLAGKGSYKIIGKPGVISAQAD